MINAKRILPVVLATATLLAGGVSAATNAEDSSVNTCPEISVQYEEKLSEKLEAGELTQEQYDGIITAIESRDFCGAWGKGAMQGIRGNVTELTEEQKAELSAKVAEMLSEKMEAGEITQEQYDEIIAAIESGTFAGHGSDFGKFGELTEEQKAEIAEKWSENALGGKFGGKFGNRIHGGEELTDEQKAEIAEKWSENAQGGKFDGMFDNRIHGGEELTEEQKAEIAEKQAEVAENGGFGAFSGFGAFQGGMRGNFGARNK